MSRCLGTEPCRVPSALRQISCPPPWRTKTHPSSRRWRSRSPRRTSNYLSMGITAFRGFVASHCPYVTLSVKSQSGGSITTAREFNRDFLFESPTGIVSTSRSVPIVHRTSESIRASARLIAASARRRDTAHPISNRTHQLTHASASRVFQWCLSTSARTPRARGRALSGGRRILVRARAQERHMTSRSRAAPTVATVRPGRPVACPPSGRYSTS